MKRRDFLKAGILVTAFSQFRISAAEGGGLTPAEIETILRLHNEERALVGVKPLEWSDKLAAKAKSWAEKIALTEEFRHSGMKYGENLAGAPTVDGAFAYWMQEKHLYRPGSRFRSMEYAHYTQIVWKKSKRLGCGKASGKHFDMWVCLYDPAGNRRGKKAY